MEYLVVNFSHEALLREPVHYGFKYPYESSIKHLKGKSKNLARVGGSIVIGNLAEKTSHFTSSTLGNKPGHEKGLREDTMIGGVMPTYAVESVPDVFCQIGRLSRKLNEV